MGTKGVLDEGHSRGAQGEGWEAGKRGDEGTENGKKGTENRENGSGNRNKRTEKSKEGN
jgi:hypothetical protein